MPHCPHSIRPSTKIASTLKVSTARTARCAHRGQRRSRRSSARRPRTARATAEPTAEHQTKATYATKRTLDPFAVAARAAISSSMAGPASRRSRAAASPEADDRRAATCAHHRRARAGTMARARATHEHGGMTTVEPQPAGSEPAHKRRSPWLWVSVALAVIAVGLLVWGLKTQSDLDSARSDVDRLQAQVDQSAQDGGAARAAITSVIGALAAQIGATNADLAAAEQQIK